MRFQISFSIGKGYTLLSTFFLCVALYGFTMIDFLVCHSMLSLRLRLASFLPFFLAPIGGGVPLPTPAAGHTFFGAALAILSAGLYHSTNNKSNQAFALCCDSILFALVKMP